MRGGAVTTRALPFAVPVAGEAHTARVWVVSTAGVRRVEPSPKRPVAALEFLDDRAGLALLEEATLLRTDDGGTSWPRFTDALGAPFVSAREGLRVTKSAPAMSHPDDPSAKRDDGGDGDEALDRAAILARRSFLVRRVMVAAGAVAVGAAAASCQPCLRYAIDAEREPDVTQGSDASADADANPQPCLAPMPPPDADIDAGGGNG